MQQESMVNEKKAAPRTTEDEYEFRDYEGSLEDIEEFEHEDGEIYYNNEGEIYNADKKRVGALVKGKVVLSKYARFEPEPKYAHSYTR